jgi:hypothetical protein
MTEKILERYLKVKALAEQGAEGERDAARKILGQFEAKYDGIKAAAAAHQRSKSVPTPPPPVAAAGPASRAGWPSFTKGNWENIFRYASLAYETISSAAEAVSNAAYGTTLGQEAVEVTGYSRKDDLFIRLRFPSTVFRRLRSLNAVQKEAFRQAVQGRVDEYLDAILDA